MTNKKESNNPKSSHRGFGGPGPRGAGEKAKDFKSATKRLFKELKNFKVVILFALILAMMGAILTISAPDKLSELTDEISEGLVINKANMEELISEMKESLGTKELEIDGQKISIEDQQECISKLGNITDKNDMNQIYKSIDEMPDSIKNVLKPAMNMDKIKKITLILVVMYILSFIFSYIQSVKMAEVSNSFAKGLRARILSLIHI